MILRSRNHDLRDKHVGKESAKSGAVISSVIKGVASNGIEAGLTLDISLRLECGLDGRWGVIWSKVQDVGLPKVISPNNLKTKPAVVKPTGTIPTKAMLFNLLEANRYNHKPILVWWPKTDQGVFSSLRLARPNSIFPHSISLT